MIEGQIHHLVRRHNKKEILTCTISQNAKKKDTTHSNSLSVSVATNFANSAIVNDREPGMRSAPAKKKKFVVEESTNDRLMILEDVVIMAWLVFYLREEEMPML